MSLNVYSILLPPYVSLRTSNSIQGFTFADKDFTFGVVNTINYNCLRIQIGQSCLFNKTEAILVTVGGTDYYISDENNIILQETQPL